MNIIRITLIVLFAVFFSACKKESTNVEQSPKNVFVAKFTNNWLPDGATGYIFISDMDGNILADSSWQGDKELQLTQTDGSDFPDNITVTTIAVDSNSGSVNLISNMAVSPATWIWKGYPQLDYSQQIYFNYQNVPEHSEYLIAVPNSYKRGYNITDRNQIYVPYDVNNVYIYLNTLANGPEYLWLSNIQAGDTVNVDFSHLKKLSTKEISFPGWGKGYRFFIYGYPFSDDHYSQIYRMQSGFDRDTTLTHLNVYFPSSLFPSYRASLYIYDDYNGVGWKNYYGYLKYGAVLPSTFFKMEADFDIRNNSPLDFSIDANGDFEEIESTWAYYGSYDFSWKVYGPASMTAYQLPAIPQNILAQINGLDRGKFILSQVYLIDQIGLKSYNDIINTYFKSTKYFYDVVEGTLLRSKGGNM